MPRVVITGAAGFIGSHLSEALLDRGFSVVGIVGYRALQLGKLLLLIADARALANNLGERAVAERKHERRN